MSQARCAAEASSKPSGRYVTWMSRSTSAPPIRIGIVGASTTGWSQAVHVPALQALPSFHLSAIATSRASTADAAGRAMGVQVAHGDYRDLVRDPALDLVLVSVRVPRHAEVLRAAIERGKAVFSEWPLAVDLDQATQLARIATAKGVKTFVGLQARFQPAILYVRDLVHEGYVGDVMATTVTCSGRGWGPLTTPGHEYMYDEANGATALAVTGMHALDGVFWVLGQPHELYALSAVGRREVTVCGEGSQETITVTAPDQIAIAGRVGQGAILSCFVRGGVSRSANLRWEINGTEGDLVISSSDHNGNLQNAQLAVAGGRGKDPAVAELPIPARYTTDVPAGLTHPQQTYARLFRQLARDWADGEERVATFSNAVERHAMLDGLRRGHWVGGR